MNVQPLENRQFGVCHLSLHQRRPSAADGRRLAAWGLLCLPSSFDEGRDTVHRQTREPSDQRHHNQCGEEGGPIHGYSPILDRDGDGKSDEKAPRKPRHDVRLYERRPPCRCQSKADRPEVHSPTDQCGTMVLLRDHSTRKIRNDRIHEPGKKSGCQLLWDGVHHLSTEQCHLMRDQLIAALSFSQMPSSRNPPGSLRKHRTRLALSPSRSDITAEMTRP